MCQRIAIYVYFFCSLILQTLSHKLNTIDLSETTCMGKAIPLKWRVCRIEPLNLDFRNYHDVLKRLLILSLSGDTSLLILGDWFWLPFQPPYATLATYRGCTRAARGLRQISSVQGQCRSYINVPHFTPL